MPSPASQPSPDRPPARAFRSWGGVPPICHARVHALPGTAAAWPADPRGVLPVGLGRSYGDVGLNAGGTLLDTRFLDRLLAFDPHSGLLRAEAGLSLHDLLSWCVPRGWFVPVTPGTRQITLGGAVANDVHGKNHHRTGTFGCHLAALGLRRSDGSERTCSPSENADLFAATIGGLGLTGLITWVEMRLQAIPSGWIDAGAESFGSLDEAWQQFDASAATQEFTVAWLDGFRPGHGVFLSGNWAAEPPPGRPALPPPPAAHLTVPVDAPSWLLNRPTQAVFNRAYAGRQSLRRGRFSQDYTGFFHPLDALHDWNRLYGRRGFFQYQAVVPPSARAVIGTMLERAKRAGQPPYLVVLKEFGDIPSPGLLSFPRPGPTLAMDFPNRGPETLSLFRILDALVREAGGCWYPAKDATLAAADFQAAYPQWRAFARHLDPACQSDFWRRVSTTSHPHAGASLAASFHGP